jgi:hypothetical protein
MWPHPPPLRAPKLFADDSLHMDAWSAREKAGTALGTPRDEATHLVLSIEAPLETSRTGLTTPEKRWSSPPLCE